MGRVLTLAVLLLLTLVKGVESNPVPSSVTWLYSDPIPVGESSRLFFDTEPGIMRVYVYLEIYAPGMDATRVRFSAPKPPCLVGNWLQDEPGTAGIPIAGNSQTGVEVMLLGCMTGSNHILTIVYEVEGLTGECCLYKAMPHPMDTSGYIEVTACNSFVYDSYGEYSLINPDLETLCGVPAKPTTWSGIKKLFRD